MRIILSTLLALGIAIGAGSSAFASDKSENNARYASSNHRSRNTRHRSAGTHRNSNSTNRSGSKSHSNVPASSN